MTRPRRPGTIESARRNYARAIGLTRSSQDKIDLYFKLADVFNQTQDWRSILGCWQQIVTADPQNLRARVGRLKYAYILADSLSGVGQSMNEYWEEVLKQTTELMEVAQSRGRAERRRWRSGSRRSGRRRSLAGPAASLAWDPACTSSGGGRRWRWRAWDR